MSTVLYHLSIIYLFILLLTKGTRRSWTKSKAIHFSKVTILSNTILDLGIKLIFISFTIIHIFTKLAICALGKCWGHTVRERERVSFHQFSTQFLTILTVSPLKLRYHRMSLTSQRSHHLRNYLVRLPLHSSTTKPFCFLYTKARSNTISGFFH